MIIEIYRAFERKNKAFVGKIAIFGESLAWPQCISISIGDYKGK